MKRVDDLDKLLRLQPDHISDQFDGKTVEFICDLGGNLLLLTGQFAVRISQEFSGVDIHYSGRLDPLDPPHSHYVFHLSQAHLRSTIPARKPGSMVDYLMEKSLSRHERVNPANRQGRIASSVTCQ